MGNLQHITMYGFFLMNGIVDIICAWNRYMIFYSESLFDYFIKIDIVTELHIECR